MNNELLLDIFKDSYTEPQKNTKFISPNAQLQFLTLSRKPSHRSQRGFQTSNNKKRARKSSRANVLKSILKVTVPKEEDKNTIKESAIKPNSKESSDNIRSVKFFLWADTRKFYSTSALNQSGERNHFYTDDLVPINPYSKSNTRIKVSRKPRTKSQQSPGMTYTHWILNQMPLPRIHPNGPLPYASFAQPPDKHTDLYISEDEEHRLKEKFRIMEKRRSSRRSRSKRIGKCTEIKGAPSALAIRTIPNFYKLLPFRTKIAVNKFE
ncbi:hypothetical protein GJ496_003333 [Pomphorhynchus laevis]|nr:hypothetical protein GJ496_003333 [Pomphorhynchus laevis]